MHFTKLLSLVTLLTLASKIKFATADCCPCVNVFGWTCNDGTTCTPYCGYGQCNIFGCNCGGGCRSTHHGFSSYKISIAEDASEDYFDAADADKDGKLTFDEWVASDANKGADKEKLAKQWAKYDSAGAGFLTKTQAILRVA